MKSIFILFTTTLFSVSCASIPRSDALSGYDLDVVKYIGVLKKSPRRLDPVIFLLLFKENPQEIEKEAVFQYFLQRGRYGLAWNYASKFRDEKKDFFRAMVVALASIERPNSYEISKIDSEAAWKNDLKPNFMPINGEEVWSDELDFISLEGADFPGFPLVNDSDRESFKELAQEMLSGLSVEYKTSWAQKNFEIFSLLLELEALPKENLKVIASRYSSINHPYLKALMENKDSSAVDMPKVDQGREKISIGEIVFEKKNLKPRNMDIPWFVSVNL